MSRLADKLRWETLPSKVSCTFLASCSKSHERHLTGFIKVNRKYGRSDDKPSGKQRSESTEGAVQSQLFEILSNPSKRKISKDRESVLAQTSSLFIDTSKIPFLKYTMPERDYERFRQNKSTSEERRKVLNIFDTVLPRRKSQVPMIADSHRRIDVHSLRHHLFSRKDSTLVDVLDAAREKICNYYSIEESEYERHKEEAIQHDAQEEEEPLNEAWKQHFERMMGQPVLSGVALSLKQNSSMSDSARKDIAEILITYTK